MKKLLLFALLYIGLFVFPCYAVPYAVDFYVSNNIGINLDVMVVARDKNRHLLGSTPEVTIFPKQQNVYLGKITIKVDPTNVSWKFTIDGGDGRLSFPANCKSVMVTLNKHSPLFTTQCIQ